MEKDKASQPLYKCIEQDKKGKSFRNFTSPVHFRNNVNGSCFRIRFFKPIDSIEDNERIKSKVAAAPVIIDTHTHFYDPFRPIPPGRKILFHGPLQKVIFTGR